VHTPLPAAVEDELGEKVHTRIDFINTAAGSGLHDADCSVRIGMISGVSGQSADASCHDGEQESVLSNHILHKESDKEIHRAPLVSDHRLHNESGLGSELLLR